MSRTTRRYRAWRLRMLARRPLCEQCRADGYTVAAVELDHIRPLTKGGGLMDPGNVQGLCRRCHRAKTARDFGHAPPAERDEWTARLEAM